MLDVCFVKIVYDGFLVDKERGKGKFTKKTSDDHRHENIPVGVFLQHHQKRCRRTASAPAVKDRALPGKLRISESRETLPSGREKCIPIGSEPQDAKLDSRGHWQRTMQGHAAANMTPVIVSNRVGVEYTKYNNLQYPTNITIYGSSFITDATGEIKVQADTSSETFICHALDIAAIRKQRAAWGLFRDRRPDLYSLLGTCDGHPVNCWKE